MKNKIVGRIGAVLCALVVIISSFFSVFVFYGGISSYVYSEADFYDEDDYTRFSNLKNYVVFNCNGCWGLICFDSFSTRNNNFDTFYASGGTSGYYLEGNVWKDAFHGGSWGAIDTYCDKIMACYGFDDSYFVEATDLLKYLAYSTITYSSSISDFSITSGEHIPLGPVVDAALGYLQNISYEKLYLRGDYTYYYNEDSRKDIWSYDAATTTDLDLTSGDYSIRHYIRPVLVKNYEDDGVIEKYDKYLMGEYDASDLKFEYLRADYEKKLEEYGYEGLGFVDSLLGRFFLEWHYFQIVNNDTGEVGGYVLLKPKNATGDFGVEHVAMTVDENDELDSDGYDETVIDESTGSGSTYEEAEENAEQTTFDELAGVDAFTNSLESFATSLGNVPLAIKSIIDLFPWWVLAFFGLSFALAFVLALVKILRG